MNTVVHSLKQTEHCVLHEQHVQEQLSLILTPPAPHRLPEFAMNEANQMKPYWEDEGLTWVLTGNTYRERSKQLGTGGLDGWERDGHGHAHLPT